MIDELFVLERLLQRPTLIDLKTSTDNSIAMFLEHNFSGPLFRAFRVFWCVRLSLADLAI